MSREDWRRRAPYIALVILFALTVAYVWPTLSAPVSKAESAPAPSPSPSTHGNGLSDSHDGYLMQPVTLPTARGKARDVAFRILGPDGRPLTAYEPAQTKFMHLYALRDDLSGYQHLHPVLTGDLWTAKLDIADGGSYRLYAEFTPRALTGAGHATTLGVSFVIAGDTTLAALPAPAAASTSAELTVTRLDGAAHVPEDRPVLLQFAVTDASGAQVTALEPYLGSLAHMSAFSARDQSLTHVHAPVASAASAAASSDGTLLFHLQFADRGEQRLFLEYQVGGKVRQAAFTVFVT